MKADMPENFKHSLDQGLSSMIPWENHLDENTLGAADGSLMQIVQLRGKSFIGVSEEEIKVSLENRTRALQTINTPELGIVFYCVKRKEATDQHNDCSELRDYPRSLAAAIKPVLVKQAYSVTWYACFILSTPLSKKLKVLDFFRKKVVADVQSELLDRIETLHTITSRFVAQQAHYQPKLLGIYSGVDHDVLYSEPLRFLRYITQHRWADIPYASTLLHKRMVSHRVRFNKNGLISVGDTFIRNTNPIEFDQMLPVGCVDVLLESDFECHFNISLRYLLRGDAQSKIRLNIKQLEGTGDEAVSQMRAMEDALDMLASGEICFTQSFMSMAVFGDTDTEVKKNLESLTSRFTDRSGFIMSENTVTAKAVYLSAIPGNWKFAVRNTNGMHTLNVAALVNFANFAGGSLVSEWSDTTPIFTTTTEHNTPFHFNLHAPNSDVPHSTITGASGGGKTVLLAAIIAMSSKFKSKLFLLDIERGQEVFINALGGIYTVIKPGEKTGWNPFDLPFHAGTLSFVTRLVESMIELSGVTLTTKHFSAIQEAVKAVFELPTAMRRLRLLPSYLPSGDDTILADGLEQWVVDGGRSWVFDNESSDVLKFTNRYYGFDMTKLSEDSKVAALIFGFLAYSADTYLVDGDPVIFALEEGWAWLESDLAADRVMHWYRTGRRNKIALILATNNADVIASTKTGLELVKQSPTNIFLASERAKSSDYEAFDLTPSQISRILSMTSSQRQFAIKQHDDFVILNFDLSGADGHLEVLSGRKETLPLVEKCKQQHGQDPAVWVPHFMADAVALRAQNRRHQ